MHLSPLLCLLVPFSDPLVRIILRRPVLDLFVHFLNLLAKLKSRLSLLFERPFYLNGFHLGIPNLGINVNIL